MSAWLRVYLLVILQDVWRQKLLQRPGAFRGEVNLHGHDADMTKLLKTYAQLKAEALAVGVR